jgi:hypothetical protein
MGSSCLLDRLMYVHTRHDKFLEKQSHQEPALVCSVPDNLHHGEGERTRSMLALAKLRLLL